MTVPETLRLFFPPCPVQGCRRLIGRCASEGGKGVVVVIDFLFLVLVLGRTHTSDFGEATSGTSVCRLSGGLFEGPQPITVAR